MGVLWCTVLLLFGCAVLYCTVLHLYWCAGVHVVGVVVWVAGGGDLARVRRGRDHVEASPSDVPCVAAAAAAMAAISSSVHVGRVPVALAVLIFATTN